MQDSIVTKNFAFLRKYSKTSIQMCESVRIVTNSIAKYVEIAFPSEDDNQSSFNSKKKRPAIAESK